MPNTLAHLGIHGVVTRRLYRDAGFKWIYLGCIIPDVPWMIQRAVSMAFPWIDMYDLRLYAVVQASLFFSLALCGAVAAFSTRFLKTFLILAFGAFFHLFLDAFQIKWANGVHFFAPFDWRLISFGLFWPESIPTYLLTAFGLAYFIMKWRACLLTSLSLSRLSFKKGLAIITLVAAYFALPLLFLNGAETANNHFIDTLRNIHDRPGKYVELDRELYFRRRNSGFVRTFAGEDLTLDGMELNRPGCISLRGFFVTSKRIRVQEYHVHRPFFRDSASYLGIALVCFVFVWPMARYNGRAS